MDGCAIKLFHCCSRNKLVRSVIVLHFNPSLIYQQLLHSYIQVFI
jgi:hypothetical protein